MSQDTDAKTLSPVMLYTEQTPNPETLKFVTNRMLYAGTADFRTEDLAKEWSPLATDLYAMPFVNGVYISKNYVTVAKEFNYEWKDIMMNLKEYIKTHIQDGKTVINEGFAEAMAKLEEEKGVSYEYNDDETKIVKRIIELIDTYVKPAVEMDGGNIAFKKFDKGIVTVELQGACSGCPSSTVTLKSGIENMLKRMLPEVKEVVADMG